MVLSCVGFYINAVKWEENELRLYSLSDREICNLFSMFSDLPSDATSDEAQYALMNRFFNAICMQMAFRFDSLIRCDSV